MNKVINGKRYDTDKAEEVGHYNNGMLPGDLGYYAEVLYRKRTGELFLWAEGGAMSRCARPCEGGWSGGSELIPLDIDGARSWAEEHLTADRYAELFGEPDEDAEDVKTTFVLRAASKAKLKGEALRLGLTQSALVEQLIDKM